MHKNILTVVGITILFLGISIQPAIAVNPNSIDSEDDCNICPKVSKTHLVRLKSLINRVEILNNKLSVKSKQNPKVEGKYQELFDRITKLNGMYKVLTSDILLQGNLIICVILYIILAFPLTLWEFFNDITMYLPEDSNLSKMFMRFLEFFRYKALSIVETGENLGCWYLHPI